MTSPILKIQHLVEATGQLQNPSPLSPCKQPLASIK